MSEPLLTPPDLPGYRYLRPIDGGSGGYAQVYVYEQDAPRREVAVKVLKARGVGGTAVRDILDEANAMARLGSHPHIVTVLAARTATDGRPCIIMMFCSGPNLMQLVSGGALDVHRVVRLGIQIADVLQAAHSVHIIHRDIKPANILTDEYGSPRLTDFGIAGLVTPGEDTDDRQIGVSLPWCPPELLRGEPGSVASDIYSLGATLWHLLVGRSPVDVPGHNTREEIEHRILHVTAPATNRRDVPAGLERLLARMLAKRPDERPPSASHVMAELTQIARHLGESVASGSSWYAAPSSTAPPSTGSSTLPPDADRTSVRGSRQRRGHAPAPAPASPPGLRPAPAGLPAFGQTTLRGPKPAESTPEQPETESEPPSPGRGARGLWAAALVLVLAAVGALVVLRPWDGTGRSPAGLDPSVEATDGNAGQPFDNLPPGRPTVTAERVDAQTVRYTWEYSNPLESDTYAWQTDTGQEDTAAEPSIDLSVPEGVRVCVQVRVYRLDGSYASPTWSDPGCGGDE